MALKNNRFLHPYYTLNFLLIICYVALRVQRLNPGILESQDMFGFTREHQIYFSLTLMLFTRLLSAPTPDAYLASAFMFCRVAILVCLWYMSPRLFASFASLWVVIYALLPQPRFRIPDSVSTMNNVSFEQRVLKSQYNSFYIIWFHAPWSARCSQLAPVLARLANTYSHHRLIFGQVDVNKFRQVAEKVGIPASAASKELPCVICFKKGEEMARIPGLNARGEVDNKWARGFTHRHVAAELGLDRCLETAKRWEQEVKDKYKNKKSN
eukprot:GFKZ01009233.1.p1 GENE.GFKZ01009233.1~~GFKZ01009233.1.p1  ORF type:complete len:268 (+),score=16.74 GFKZ01009233.1:264-1067(+)